MGVARMPDTNELIRHKIDADTYYRMAEAGLLRSGDRVELIDGEIVDMAPIGQGHEATVNRLNRSLVIDCGDRAIVSTQNSVRLDARNVPEPDFILFRARQDFHGTGDRPTPNDVLLIIEVSDSSITYDRGEKLRLYAEAGIGEYWIADVNGRVVEVYRNPAGGTYRDKSTHGPDERIALALAPDMTIGLGQLFG